ncbi:TerB family tellurite resistance protein [Paraburkholderia sediminicola]|uniref:TerB family tellurite resistance protein n=1 Tax=Paraburkholderia metrosideri TaxID=580937 RepID=A0ABW9DQN3_9BURK
MRTYPRNSPQAAARIVALALTSDGHVSSAEERALESLDIAGELGLAPAQFAQIVQALCEDQSLANTPFTPPVGQVDAALLVTLIDEIDDPALRRKVIRLCIAVTIADNYLADGEIALLAAVFNAWGPKPNQTASRHITLPGTLHAHPRTAATT